MLFLSLILLIGLASCTPPLDTFIVGVWETEQFNIGETTTRLRATFNEDKTFSIEMNTPDSKAYTEVNAGTYSVDNVTNRLTFNYTKYGTQTVTDKSEVMTLAGADNKLLMNCVIGGDIKTLIGIWVQYHYDNLNDDPETNEMTIDIKADGTLTITKIETVGTTPTTTTIHAKWVKDSDTQFTISESDKEDQFPNGVYVYTAVGKGFSAVPQEYAAQLKMSTFIKVEAES